MRFFFIEVSFIIFMFTSTLAEISNLFTDWDFPSSDAQSALDEPNPGPSLSAADSINNDMFAFSDAFEVLADSTSQCSSSSTYSSRRRDTTCGAEEDPDEFSDDSLLTYRDMALLNAKEQLSKLDEKQCPEDAFPYFICSSKNPDDTEWVTSLISFICRNSARGKYKLFFFSSSTIKTIQKSEAVLTVWFQSSW